MAQSFMAVATASAMAGSSGAPCLMVFCRALKTGLGRRCALHLLVEDVVAEQVLDVRLLEVDVLQAMLGGRDRLDGGLAEGQVATHGGCLESWVGRAPPLRAPGRRERDGTRVTHQGVARPGPGTAGRPPGALGSIVWPSPEEGAGRLMCM